MKKPAGFSADETQPKGAFTQNKSAKFCVNRGDKLVCFYINVVFENIGN